MNTIKIEHNEIRIEGLKNKYTFLHITDTHVVLFGEGETPERAEYEAPRAKAFTRNGIRPEDNLLQCIEYANAHQLSGVLMTGDIVDCPSPENIAFLESALAKLQVPYVYMLGNHDWNYFNDYMTEYSIAHNRPLFRPFCGGDEDFHVKQIGELTFVALDNSMDDYYPGTVERLKAVLNTAENVIILQHVPLNSPAASAWSIKDWKRDITLGKDGIDYEEEGGTTEEIRQLMIASPSVKAIICGHLHHSVNDPENGTIDHKFQQFLTADGIMGLFEIHG